MSVHWKQVLVQASRTRQILYREKKVIECSPLYKSDYISNFLEVLQRGAASELE